MYYIYTSKLNICQSELKGQHIKGRNFRHFMEHFVWVLVPDGCQILLWRFWNHGIQLENAVFQLGLCVPCVMHKGWGPITSVAHQECKRQASSSQEGGLVVNERIVLQSRFQNKAGQGQCLYFSKCCLWGKMKNVTHSVEEKPSLRSARPSLLSQTRMEVNLQLEWKNIGINQSHKPKEGAQNDWHYRVTNCNTIDSPNATGNLALVTKYLSKSTFAVYCDKE